LSNGKVRMQELRIEKALIGNVLAMAQQKIGKINCWFSIII